MEERIVEPDPIREPEAYQKALVALLGDQDPLEVLAATPDAIATATDGLSEEVLQAPPEPGEWSAEQVVAHLFTAEIVYAFRWRLTVAQDGETYPGYDQEVWVDLPHPPLPEMAIVFTELRRANVAFLREVPEDAWDRVGNHVERGPESLRLAVQLLAGHDLAHLRQLEQTIEVVTQLA